MDEKFINNFLISSINEDIKDETHLKRLIFDWKRAAAIGAKPSKNTGSGGSSGHSQLNQLLLETFGGEGSANGVTVIKSSIIIFK